MGAPEPLPGRWGGRSGGAIVSDLVGALARALRASEPARRAAREQVATRFSLTRRAENLTRAVAALLS